MQSKKDPASPTVCPPGKVVEKLEDLPLSVLTETRALASNQPRSGPLGVVKPLENVLDHPNELLPLGPRILVAVCLNLVQL